MFNLEEALLLQ